MGTKVFDIQPFMKKDTDEGIPLRTLKAKLTDDQLATWNAISGRGSSVMALTDLMVWFMDQPDVLRKAILNLLPEGMEVDVVQLALKKMAETNKSGRRKS